MVKLQKGNLYCIQGIKNENYNDCRFIFGDYRITAIDGQYFQVMTMENSPELNRVWWDSEGFKITEVK
jgi:hypothetical protein